MDHPTILRRAGDHERRAPLIVRRTDEEFIPALLDELGAPGGLAALSGRAVDDGASLKLFQPVHRTFQVALVDLACDVYGRPRVDPARILGAGLVVRRVGRGGGVEGWVQDGRAARGWTPLEPAHEELDPEPEGRRPALSAGNGAIDRLLAGVSPGGAAPHGRESASGLYVAPPAVCAAAGRTVLYGLIPVTSPERIERPPAEAPYDARWYEQNLRGHLPTFMRAGARTDVPRAGGDVRYADAGADDLKPFMTQLRQARVELGALEDSAFLAQLNRVSLGFPGGGSEGMGAFLARAGAVLLENSGGALTMPTSWPLTDSATGEALLSLARAKLRGRLDAFLARQGRYDEPGRQYRVRAFVRLRRDDGCPPEIVWSDYSQPFTIAAWYESADTPPLCVELPNVLDPNVLRQLKPNVAFTVPSDLFNFLNGNDPKKLMEGDGKRGGGIVLDWICSFNIPIITLCAFIVLNIFLSLFDLIFQWLIFIKICIPFPRRS